jgi:hypothetical protein
MDWTTWLQDVSKNTIDAAVKARYQQPYDIQRLQLEALGQNGYYVEGQTGAIRQTQQQINPTILLLIAGVVAVMMLKSD